MAFEPQDKQVTAVVGVGADVPKSSRVTITWYRRENLDRRIPLFTHQIDVNRGGRAFSRAVTTNGIKPGLYETVATLGDQEVSTLWTVPQPMPTGATSQEIEDWDVPGPGTVT